MSKSYLIMEKGLLSQTLFQVDARLTIGRGLGNDIQLSDPSVSMRHAAVYLEDGRPIVEDLGSLNGTFVNGKRVSKGHLSSGDVLRLGRVSLRFLQEQDLSKQTDMAKTQEFSQSQTSEDLSGLVLSGRYKSLVEIYAEIPIFSHLDNEVLDQVSQGGELLSVDQGTNIIHQGDRGRSLYIVLEGKVGVFMCDHHGKEILLSYLSEGQFFGEISLLTGAPRTATVRAVEKSLLCKLSFETMRRLIQKFPAIEDILEQYHRQRLGELLKALRESENRYRILLNGASDAIFIHDLTGKFLEVNQVACDRLGFSEEEFLQMTYTNIDSREHAELIPKRLDELRQFGRLIFETEHFTKEGKSIPVEVSSQMIDYADEQAILSIARDITGRKKAEREKMKLEAQLLQSQKMEALSRLAGGIAHDFNNLLARIIGHADLILTNPEKSGAPCWEDVEAIKRAGERAGSLVGQLLAFSRKQALQPVVLDLNTVVADMDKILRRLIGKDIELKTILKPDLDRVMVDPSQIEQIIINLAVNAKDAMPQGGKLAIETANVNLTEDHFRSHGVELQPGPYVMLALSDTGIGMDAETKSRVFEPFFTTKETGKGTGLGLATVYGIVKQSDGYIWVYSEPGQGTTFKIYLPSANDRKNRCAS